MAETLAVPPTTRAQQVVDAAREVLERDGPAALTMRRIAGDVGIRAPSLYKHFPTRRGWRRC